MTKISVGIKVKFRAKYEISANMATLQLINLKLRVQQQTELSRLGAKTVKTEILVTRLGENVNNNFRPRERYFFVYTFEKNESPGKKKHRIQIYFDEFFYPK